jgi:chaperone modulatory protein CbpM
MTMETHEFIDRSRLDAPTLRACIDAEWLLPATSEMKFMFSEVDLARARLIRDLKVDLGVNDDGIAIVLHLLDQLHGLRRLLREMQAMEISDQAKDAG